VKSNREGCGCKTDLTGSESRVTKAPIGR
jgi:hypothetical protein